MKRRPTCQVCLKQVKLTSLCICGKWLCSKCTVYRLDHSTCHDKEHIKLFWNSHPEEKKGLESIQPLIEEEAQKKYEH